MPTIPTIHPNGNSKAALTRQYNDAAQKVMDAIDAMNAIEFHKRDYYVQGEEAWDKAQIEFKGTLHKLHDVQDYLDEILAGIIKQ